MKKISKLSGLFAAAVFLQICFIFSSCSDSENDNKTPETIPTMYSISITQSAGGSVTVKAGDEDENLYFATAQAGTQITLTAEADDGYFFDSFIVTGVTLESIIENPQVFIMPANEVEVRANFISYSALRYSIDIANNIQNGTVSIQGGLIEAAETATITVITVPVAEFQLVSVTVTPEEGLPISADISGNRATFSMPASNVNVSAVFAFKPGFHLQGTSKYSWGITAGQKINLQAGNYTAGVRYRGNSSVFRLAANIVNTGGGESPWFDLIGGETKPMPPSVEWIELTGDFVLNTANDLFVFLITNPTDNIPITIERIWIYKDGSTENLLSNGNFENWESVKTFANDAPGPIDFIQTGFWYIISDWQIVDPENPENSWYPKNSQIPKMADSFVESIGVCTHLSYWDTTYNLRWHDVVFNRLIESGIRYIRDDLPTWFNGTTTTINNLKEERFRALAAHGIRLNAVMWARDEDHSGGHRPDHRGPIFSADQIASMLLTNNVYEYVVSVEGPNEYNWPGMPYHTTNWVDVLKTYMPNLHSAIRNNPALSHLDIIGPSLVLEQYWAGPQNQRDRRNDHLLLGDVSQWVDYGNMHLYPHGNIPSYNVDYEMNKMNVCFPGKLYMVTETGHFTLVDSGGGGFSERADGIHMPRFFLEYFNRGIKRSFKYQLIDEFDYDTDAFKNNPGDPEHYFGLIDRTGRPKPAYYSIKNLISILNDKGPDFTPRALNYTITGGDSAIHHTLLQKRDGRFYLCLWSEVKSMSADGQIDVFPPKQNITVTLNSINASSVKIYENLSNSTMTITTIGAVNVINIGVNDEVVILEITP